MGPSVTIWTKVVANQLLRFSHSRQPDLTVTKWSVYIQLTHVFAEFGFCGYLNSILFRCSKVKFTKIKRVNRTDCIDNKKSDKDVTDKNKLLRRDKITDSVKLEVI